jgi:hypothetical protein
MPYKTAAVKIQLISAKSFWGRVQRKNKRVLTLIVLQALRSESARAVCKETCILVYCAGARQRMRTKQRFVLMASAAVVTVCITQQNLSKYILQLPSLNNFFIKTKKIKCIWHVPFSEVHPTQARERAHEKYFSLVAGRRNLRRDVAGVV